MKVEAPEEESADTGAKRKEYKNDTSSQNHQTSGNVLLEQLMNRDNTIRPEATFQNTMAEMRKYAGYYESDYELYEDSGKNDITEIDSSYILQVLEPLISILLPRKVSLLSVFNTE